MHLRMASSAEHHQVFWIIVLSVLINMMNDQIFCIPTNFTLPNFRILTHIVLPVMTQAIFISVIFLAALVAPASASNYSFRMFLFPAEHYIHASLLSPARFTVKALFCF